MGAWDPWTYREPDVRPSTVGRDIARYDVEATNGFIGTVDEATYTVGSSYIVVDTGPWVFGARFMMIPAGTIDRIDVRHARVCIDLTKDQIKNAPPFDPVAPTSIEYRDDLADYYGRLYAGVGR